MEQATSQYAKYGPCRTVTSGPANGEVTVQRRNDEVNVSVDGHGAYLSASDAIRLAAVLMDAASEVVVFNGWVNRDA